MDVTVLYVTYSGIVGMYVKCYYGNACLVSALSSLQWMRHDETYFRPCPPGLKGLWSTAGHCFAKAKDSQSHHLINKLSYVCWLQDGCPKNP